MSIDIERVIEAIRFDVDYNCTEARHTPPQQGSINRELYLRINKMERKDLPILTTNARKRVLNSLKLKATPENHTLFNTAVEVFKRRLNTHAPESNVDFSGTGMMIEG